MSVRDKTPQSESNIQMVSQHVMNSENYDFVLINKTRANLIKGSLPGVSEIFRPHDESLYTSFSHVEIDSKEHSHTLFLADDDKFSLPDVMLASNQIGVPTVNFIKTNGEIVRQFNLDFTEMNTVNLFRGNFPPMIWCCIPSRLFKMWLEWISCFSNPPLFLDSQLDYLLPFSKSEFVNANYTYNYFITNWSEYNSTSRAIKNHLAFNANQSLIRCTFFLGRILTVIFIQASANRLKLVLTNEEMAGLLRRLDFSSQRTNSLRKLSALKFNFFEKILASRLLVPSKFDQHAIGTKLFHASRGEYIFLSFQDLLDEVKRVANHSECEQVKAMFTSAIKYLDLS